MNCPLGLNYKGTLGTVDYYAPCECVSVCELSKCQYNRCGLIVKFNSIGGTGTNTVSILSTKCGGAIPLVNSAGALIANSELTAGAVYTVYPQYINGIVRGLVPSL